MPPEFAIVINLPKYPGRMLAVLDECGRQGITPIVIGFGKVPQSIAVRAKVVPFKMKVAATSQAELKGVAKFKGDLKVYRAARRIRSRAFRDTELAEYLSSSRFIVACSPDLALLTKIIADKKSHLHPVLGATGMRQVSKSQ